MPSVTVRDVLRQIERYHARLSVVYAQAAEQGANPRARLLAAYLADREIRLMRALKRYEQDPASARTLACWLPVAPLLGGDLDLAEIRLEPGFTTGDLFALGARLDACLAACFDRLAEAASATGVRELFADLRALEEAEARQTASATLEVEREL